MRRTARLLTGTALAVGAVGLLVAPAPGDDGGGLKVSPSSVVPGGQVTVHTGACGDGGTAAGDASAVGAGTFALAPGTRGRDADGRFRVPPSAQPGTYEIVAACAKGGRRVTGDLVVTLSASHAQVYPKGR